MDKKLINSKIIAVKNELINKNSKIENSLAYKCEIPERNKRTDRKQNKIRDKNNDRTPSGWRDHTFYNILISIILFNTIINDT